MAYSCCIPRSSSGVVPLAIRSLGSSIEHRRLLSTNPVTVIESAFDKTVPRLKSPEVFPVPNGFPFAIRKSLLGLELTREDQFEKTEVEIFFGKPRVEDGNPSVVMRAHVYRGYIHTNIEAVLKPDSIRIYRAQIRECRNRHLETFEEFLETKGINNASFLNYLFDFFNQKQKENVSNANVSNKCAM